MPLEGREDAAGRMERLTIEVDLKKESNPQHFPSIASIAKQLAAQAA